MNETLLSVQYTYNAYIHEHPTEASSECAQLCCPGGRLGHSNMETSSPSHSTSSSQIGPVPGPKVARKKATETKVCVCTYIISHP